MRWAMVAACLSVAVCAMAARPLLDAQAVHGAQTLLNAEAKSQDPARPGVGSAKAEQIIRHGLAWSPGDASAWASLSYAQALETGRLTPAASETLLKSYKLSPYDADLLLWRTAFVFRNWTDAPTSLRDAAFEEVNAFSRFNIHRRALTDLAPYITDPSGQFALVLAAVGGAGAEPEQ